MDAARAPHGLYLPLITPFDEDGSVAVDALESLAHHGFDHGARGLVALGTTAEAATLDPAERLGVLDACARVARERGGELIVGAGGNDTRRSAAELAALGDRPEVTGALLPVPPFSRPGERGVLAHVTALAAVSPVPLVLYHVSYRTGQALTADTLRLLGKLPQVVGVKLAVGGIDADTVDLFCDLPPGFAVLAGDDEFAGALLGLGAHGGILASAQVCPDAYALLIRAWRDGDLAAAQRWGAVLARLARTLFAEPNPAVIKGVLHAEGRIPTPAVRLPLLPAAPESVAAALDARAAVRSVMPAPADRIAPVARPGRVAVAVAPS